MQEGIFSLKNQPSSSMLLPTSSTTDSQNTTLVTIYKFLFKIDLYLQGLPHFYELFNHGEQLFPVPRLWGKVLGHLFGGAGLRHVLPGHREGRTPPVPMVSVGFGAPAWQVCSAGGCWALALGLGVIVVGFAVGVGCPLEALHRRLVTCTGPLLARIPGSWKKIRGMEAGKGCEGQGEFFGPSPPLSLGCLRWSHLWGVGLPGPGGNA